MCSINEVFEMLDWNSDEETQRRGIKEARKIKHLSILFQPVESKAVWENCAKVIASKDDDVLSHYIDGMLEWLVDANWPGFFIIYDRLKEIDADIIYSSYCYWIDIAEKLEMENWLDYMAGLIEDPKLYEMLSEEQQRLMSEHYKNFWG